MQAPRRLARILRGADTELLELFCAVALLTWGLVVGNPLNDTFATSTAFRALRQTGMPEWLFGLLFLLTGAVQMVALARWREELRALAGLVAGGLWTFLSATIFISNPRGTGWSTYGVIALAAFGCVVRLAIDASHGYGRRR